MKIWQNEYPGNKCRGLLKEEEEAIMAGIKWGEEWLEMQWER